MNICIVSTFTSQLIKNILEERFRDLNIDVSITVSEYNIIHDLISDDSIILQSHFDFIVLLLLFEDMQKIADLPHYLQICRSKTQATLLISNLISPAISNLYDFNQPEGHFELFVSYQSALKKFIISDKPKNTYFLDLNSLSINIGHDNFFDPRLFYAFQIPFSQRGMEEVARLIFRAIHCLTRPRKKCIVLDCDNTLWGGIIGEDGMEGIKLGPTYPGNCYVQFQQQLLQLKNIGYILALNSKNNEPDVLEVLDRHPCQILRKTDFVNRKINWDNKLENFIKLSKELNLGLESFIFFDDNPAEIQLVGDNLPDITTILVPKDNPVKIISLIDDNYEVFDILQVTEEDKTKTAMYLANACREELKRSIANIDEYYRSLEMVMEVRKNLKSDILRLSQMTIKTNQFNVITKRRSEDEINSLIAQNNIAIYCFKLVDKFGDNGIVGYCEIQQNGDNAEITNFLMSCRVIGRNAEREFLTEIIKDLRSSGIKTIGAKWVKTAKNAICENFFDNYGFCLESCSSEEKIYQLDIEKADLCSTGYFSVNCY